MKRVGVLSLLSGLLLAPSAFAQTVVVNGSGTPFTTSLANPGANDVSCAGYEIWCAYDVRSNASVGQTTANPRSGNGSLAFSSPDGDGKADFDFFFAPQNQFRIKDVATMSYDWFRNSSSTNHSIQVPAIRLIVQGPNSLYTDMLVYEPFYQGSTTAAGLWQTASITTNSFFWWNKDAGARCAGGPDYSVSLGDWGDGHTTTASACSYSILDNAKVLGFSVGVGSGWNGVFDGAVDNVSFKLNGQDEATTYNFEVAGQSVVPEPSSYAMMLAGLAGLGFVARRRRNTDGAQR